MCALRVSSDGRYFINPFHDYTPNIEARTLLDAGNLRPAADWNQKINACITRLMTQLEDGIKNHVDDSDYSVYTGMAGIALLFFHMFDKMDRRQDRRYLNRAHDLILPYLDTLKKKRVRKDEVTFLCGDAGPLALAAVVFHFLERPNDRNTYLQKLLNMADDVVTNAEIPDELLYGRAGYLYALLFIRHYIDDDGTLIQMDIINRVIGAIRTSGETLSAHKKSRCALLYRWHHSYYMGAAHGMSGIYFLLMRTEKFNQDEKLRQLVKQSVDFMVEQKFPSGNYPSSLEKERDELVHWCHGAPGFIHMFIQAYRVFGEEKYLNEARSCSEVLWSRGLLLKGYGLCHGPAGNGYGFLALYELTQEIKYLYRALKFCEWIFDYGNHGCRIADRPYSLFEGMAGTIYYLVDCLHPNEAAFPAFYY